MNINKRRPLCNNNPESAPHINGRCFWLCWRCIGVISSTFVVTFLSFVFDYDLKMKMAYFLLIIPACVDYFLIRAKITRASNLRRFIAGAMLGIPITVTLLSFLN